MCYMDAVSAKIQSKFVLACSNRGYKVCTSCLDGLYLLQNTTNVGTSLSYCVPDCALANPRFVNNPMTMQCVDCGEGCTSCNIYTGCEVCLGVTQQSSFLYELQTHPAGLATTFSKCQKCHRLSSYQECMTCTADPTTFETSGVVSCIKCTYGVSDNDCAGGNCLYNYENCDYTCDESWCQCTEGRFEAYLVCTSCAISNCLSCDNNGCYSCNRGYTVVASSNGFVTSCAQCTSDSMFLKDCAACTQSSIASNTVIECSMCESSLVLSGSTCETSCPRGQYIQSQTLESTGVYENNVCETCDPGCYECSDQGSSQCISCMAGFYLKLSAAGSYLGTCNQISTDLILLDLFVKAEYIETTGDGSYDNPFGNIVRALSYAEEQASMYTNSTINIYLMKGNHFMTRNFAHYGYKKTTTSQYSYSYNINIQPAFCGQMLGGHLFRASDNDCIITTDKITVYYQMGSSYNFIVPSSFKISSVIFDALDSSLSSSENCLNENSQCCTLNSDKTLNINTLNPSPASSCSVTTIQTEECKTTYGESLFQFGYSDTLSNINGIGILTISNCVFQNFFYSFNSLIGLTNDYGKVSISGTTFDKFSNCGSIIRDTAVYPSGLNYISAGLKASTANTYRDSMFTSNLYQTKYFVTPSNYCQDNTCASIEIESSTFQNFNYLKTGGHTYHKVDVNSNMKYQGLILNLNSFYGTIAFYNNQVINMKFAYNNCEEVYNSASTLDSADIWGTPTILQAKTMIYINVKSSAIEIYGNTFSNCNSLLGLIYLQRSSAYNSPILIHNNLFSQNSAMIGANIIKLHMFTSISYASSFNLDYMICAGVQISSNIFKQNIGCFNTIGAIQAVCYTDVIDVDPSTQTNHYMTPQPMSMTSANNICK